MGKTFHAGPGARAPRSPSAMPLRRSAVEGIVAALRGLAPEEMFAEASRMHAELWAGFEQDRGYAMAALPPDVRSVVEARTRLAGRLGDAGSLDRANAIHRWTYRLLGLEQGARDLEEVAAGYTMAIGERIEAGMLGGQRLPLYRYAGYHEAISLAKSGLLTHHGGQDHLSFSLYPVKEYEDRPVLLALVLTGNVKAHLRALEYRSMAFSAPGSRPRFREVWDGTKLWKKAYECEVRLRVDVPVRGLDLTVYLKEFPDRDVWRALRGLCGPRRVIVPESWPLDL